MADSPIHKSQPLYPNKFAEGDTAIAKKTIEFLDGSIHRKGYKLSVTKRNAAYFNVWHNLYEKEDIGAKNP